MTMPRDYFGVDEMPPDVYSMRPISKPLGRADATSSSDAVPILVAARIFYY